MPYWTDLTDTQLAEGAAPLSEIAFAWRENQRCAATKPLEMDDFPADSTNSTSYIEMFRLKVWIPEDTPDGFVVAVPYTLSLDDTSLGNAGTVRLTLGANSAEEAVASSGAPKDALTKIALDTSLRGTEADLIVEGKSGGSGYSVTTQPAGRRRGLASIRRS